ncbi:MAG: hypothetical protein J6T54_12540 [Fibrobacter sp.]|nr:hypothetical protein [Fibrobacter sp.]
MDIEDFMPALFIFLLGVGIGFGGSKLYECLNAETSCERHGGLEICVDRYVWENAYIKRVK